LHLLAWFGLISDHRIIALLRQESGHELLQDCYATLIAVGRQRRNSAAPGRRRGATCGGQIAPDKPGASPPILPSWRSCYKSGVASIMLVSMRSDTVARGRRSHDDSDTGSIVMAAQIKRDLYAEVTSRILAELERGAAPWVKPWSATPGQNVPQNAVTNRPYSGCNVILLWFTRGRGWPTPRFVTFKQAQGLAGACAKASMGLRFTSSSSFA
jgi:hypothetical protein